jgi:alkylation response protein AidB-like acyl-CoA dehydrogenase
MHPCEFFAATLGCVVESGLEKQFCDSPASRVYSGTSEIQKMIFAARVDP